MDPVSNLLRRAQVDARLDKRCLLGGTTRMQVPRYGELQAPFHVLLDGTCQLQLETTVLRLKAGDVVLIPDGSPHQIITSGIGPYQGTCDTEGPVFATTRSEDGTAAVIDLFCGHYRFEAGAGAMLFASLPNPVHVSFGRSAESREVLRMVSALMRGEARREGDGTAAILSGLSTVLLAMLLRSSRGATTTATLWTAANDERIRRTIEQVMRDPGAPWSIDRLHRDAAMSRATFLRRFTRNTGTTVGAFLTRARLMAAADMLNSTDATVASIAATVGYQSESSFTRAFRAELGTTPARFRRVQQQLRTASAEPNPE